MTNQNAARILTALAAQDPDYEALSEEYAAVLDGAAGVEIPLDFAARTLDLLRTDPETAAEIHRYERNLSQMQTFGFGEVEQALLLAAVMILLLRPHVEFRTEWNLKFFKGALKFNTSAVDDKTLKPVFSVLSAVAKKAAEGLNGVSKALDGQSEDAAAPEEGTDTKGQADAG